MTLSDSLMRMMNGGHRRSGGRGMTFGKTLMGAALGAGAWWLFKTQRGNELRHRLMDQGQRLLKGATNGTPAAAPQQQQFHREYEDDFDARTTPG